MVMATNGLSDAELQEALANQANTRKAFQTKISTPEGMAAYNKEVSDRWGDIQNHQNGYEDSAGGGFFGAFEKVMEPVMDAVIKYGPAVYMAAVGMDAGGMLGTGVSDATMASAATDAGVASAGTASAGSGLGSLSAVDAGFGGTSLADIAGSGALETGLGGTATSAATSGVGLAGTASGGMPVVTIGAPGAAAGSAGVTAGEAAAGAGGLGAIANGVTPTDTTPSEFSDENVQKNATESLDKGTTKAIDAVSPTQGTTLSDIKNVGQGLNSILGAFTDKGNAQNASGSATSQIAALLDAQKAAQANQAAYQGQLNGAITSQTAANQAYQTQLNSQIADINKNQAAYKATMDTNVDSNTAHNADYTKQLQDLATQQRAADEQYMSALTGMYKPGTAEANLMQHQMDAKDAAAGRNSQYGTRAVDLAGQLATLRGQLMTSSGYLGALNHTTANGMITSQGYLDAMNNKSATDLLNSQSYQNSINNKAQTDLMTSQAYQDSLHNTSANNILTSGAMSNTVNNSSLLGLLSSPGYIGLNQTATNAQNNQNNSLFGTAASLLSNGSSLYDSGSKLWSGLSNLF